MSQTPKKTGCLTQGCLLTAALLAFVVLLPALQGMFGGGHEVGTLPGVSLFLAMHPEFGTPASTQEVPNWAKGARQRVNFNGGRSLLFYLQSGKVVTVYEDTDDRGRQKVWGEYAVSE